MKVWALMFCTLHGLVASTAIAAPSSFERLPLEHPHIIVSGDVANRLVLTADDMDRLRAEQSDDAPAMCPRKSGAAKQINRTGVRLRDILRQAGLSPALGDSWHRVAIIAKPHGDSRYIEYSGDDVFNSLSGLDIIVYFAREEQTGDRYNEQFSLISVGRSRAGTYEMKGLAEIEVRRLD